jgi:hypothetical protein
LLKLNRGRIKPFMKFFFILTPKHSRSHETFVDRRQMSLCVGAAALP